MIFDIKLKKVIEMYKNFFEKLDKLKTGKDINKNLETLNKINFLYKTFPIRLKNGDVIYINYDEGNFNYSIKYNNHNERLNIIDKRGIKKVLNSYVRDIDFPSYLLSESIFKSSSNFNDDFKKVNAEYSLFIKYEENVNSNNDINNNPELESINSTINHLTSSINELRKLAYDLQEETWKKEKEFEKRKLYNYYRLIVNSTRDYLSEKSDNINEVIWGTLGVLYFFGFPIVFTELVTVPDYLFVALAVALAPIVIKPLSYLSLIPFVPSIRKRLKKKYSNGEIDENTVLGLKKTIEQNNKDIKEIKEKVDELKKARIKLNKISIKKENNYNKEKNNTISNNNINLVENTHDLCQELNTVVAMEQSPKVRARVQNSLIQNKRY